MTNCVENAVHRPLWFKVIEIKKIQARLLFIVPQLQYLFQLWNVFITGSRSLSLSCQKNTLVFESKISFIFWRDQRTQASDVRAVADVNWQANIFIESNKHSSSLQIHYNTSKSPGMMSSFRLVQVGLFHLIQFGKDQDVFFELAAVNRTNVLGVWKCP